MGGMSGLNIAFSGLKAAQAGLYVTGHNMSNTETVSYSRQRVLQYSAFSQNVGVSANGYMQVGLGTDINSITNIRDKFLDRSYREKMSTAGFYGAKYDTGREMETIIGELDGQYRLQTSFNNLWDSIQELMGYPDGIDTRANFIQYAHIFVDRITDAYNSMFSYQQLLDLQIRDGVNQVNDLLDRINELNSMISTYESTGDHANDYRDEREYCLDQLSQLVDITYKEDTYGRMNIQCGSHDLLRNGFVNRLGLQYCSDNCTFVNVVFTNSTEILDKNTIPAPTSLYNLTGTISSSQGNDTGALRGLLVSRGLEPATYASTATNAQELFSLTQCMIPKYMQELDTIVHSLVTMINDAFAPYCYVDTTPGINAGKRVYLVDEATNTWAYEDGTVGTPNSANILAVADEENCPYDAQGNKTFTEIFSRKGVDRFDYSSPIVLNGVTYYPYNAEDPTDSKTLYTIANLQLNPIFRGEDDGADYIATSLSGDKGDQDLLESIMEQWKSLGISAAYNSFVASVGTETSEAENNYSMMYTTALQLDQDRQSISGVSLDEEMSNMLKYQYAYNAASRMVDVLDNMLDRLINGTGRAGL